MASRTTASVRTRFNVLNIKLRLPNAKEATERDYSDLMMRLATIHARVIINPSVGIIIKRCLIQPIGDNNILWGYLTRYTPVDTDKLVNLANPDEDDATAASLPRNTAPNPHDTAFFFTPSNHRLAISLRGRKPLPIKYAYQFFAKALPKVLLPGQEIDIDIEQSDDIYTDILEAKKVNRVRILVNYTNNDVNDALVQAMDNRLKSSHVRRLLVEATADSSTEGIDISKNEFLEGTLGLAKSNGQVEANIYDRTGRRRTIKTENHPLQSDVTSKQESDILRDVYAKLLSLFPRSIKKLKA